MCSEPKACTFSGGLSKDNAHGKQSDQTERIGLKRLLVKRAAIHRCLDRKQGPAPAQVPLCTPGFTAEKGAVGVPMSTSRPRASVRRRKMRKFGMQPQL
jgi:hypothetical protein